VALSAAILGGVVAGMLVARARAREAFHVAHELNISTGLCASRVAEFRAGIVGRGRGEFAEPSAFAWRIQESRKKAPPGLQGRAVGVTPPGNRDAAETTIVLWRFAGADSEEQKP